MLNKSYGRLFLRGGWGRADGSGDRYLGQAQGLDFLKPIYHIEYTAKSTP